MKPDSLPLPRVYRKCFIIASRAHRGQLYGTQSYFRSHVIPLAEFFRKRGMWEEACLALLHDTVEDHPDKVTYISLSISGVPGNIVRALRCITKEKGVAYTDYLERVMTDDMAWRVKIRDVIANINGPNPTQRRLLKYAAALQRLVAEAPPHIVEMPTLRTN